MQLPPVSYSPQLSIFLRWYYLAPDHPCKLRLLRCVEAIAGRKRIAVNTQAGFRFAVDRRDYIQNRVFKTRCWEHEIEEVLIAELMAQDIFFDIGANAGYFSLFALRLGCHRVVSFEPNPELQAVFLHNMRLNEVSEKRFNLVRSALSDTEGEFIYQEGPIENSGTGHLTNLSGTNCIPVRTETIDRLLQRTDLPLPTVIKLDVEGWELNVLCGAENLFENAAPRIVIFEADCDKDCQIKDKRLLHFFQIRGYTIRHLCRKEREEKENYVASRI